MLLTEINVIFSLQASIDVLIKFVFGKYTGKAARGKKKGRGGSVLKRPVICICNDIYVPALRSLRQIALIVHFPPTASSRLALLLSCLHGSWSSAITCLIFVTCIAHRQAILLAF